jgi:F-type H+-transporting ATPase subunit alpha
VKEFEKEFLEYMEVKHKKVLETIKSGVIDDDVQDILTAVAKEVSERFK